MSWNFFNMVRGIDNSYVQRPTFVYQGLSNGMAFDPQTQLVLNNWQGVLNDPSVAINSQCISKFLDA